MTTNTLLLTRHVFHKKKKKNISFFFLVITSIRKQCISLMLHRLILVSELTFTFSKDFLKIKP